ncbi:MAG: hypothetical protein CFH38_01169, partial [Alphaproteobacteria bacterium MarineAlpha10_Bin1]
FLIHINAAPPTTPSPLFEKILLPPIARGYDVGRNTANRRDKA